jgi:hypothetical protein
MAAAFELALALVPEVAGRAPKNSALRLVGTLAKLAAFAVILL